MTESSNDGHQSKPEPTPTSSAERVWPPLASIVMARLREFCRQPEAVFWVYLFPILMVIALGVAFRNKPVEIIAVDLTDSPALVEIAKSLRQQKGIKLHVLSQEECANRLRIGKTDVYLSATEANPNSLEIEYFFDPTRPGSIVARQRVNNWIQQSAGRSDPIQTATHEMSEPGGRYIDFLVPGLLGMGLMGGGLWGVGFAIVDMRIRKLLKRFLATPMRKSDFLIGIMVSRLFFMVPEIFVLILFSYWFFGVTMFGSWLSLMFLVLLGACQFSGIGLLVASRAKTLESVSGLMNLVMLPMWTLCGIFFSYERFPEIAQHFIKFLPLTALIDSLRAVMLEGTSLLLLWPQLLTMTIWTVFTFALALRWFRWQD